MYHSLVDHMKIVHLILKEAIKLSSDVSISLFIPTNDESSCYPTPMLGFVTLLNFGYKYLSPSPFKSPDNIQNETSFQIYL